MKLSPTHSGGRRAFTLLEILIVITVISILLALAVPAILGPLASTSLSAAAQTTVGQLRSARQEAVTRNRNVEVRFYEVDGATRQWQALVVEEDGELSPLGSIQRLPEGVVVSDAMELTVLGPSRTPGPGELPSGFPGGTTYRSFRFLVDGSTDLGLSEHWFLTLVREVDPGTPPANFATIQIEPLTGAARLHRP